MKLWSGRFTSPISKLADEFNTSLPFDKRLYRCDITASIAHCTMLGKCSIISQDEAKAICDGLSSILDDIDNKKLIIEDAEDIHTFVENELVNRIGLVGKKLHTARSRNDQVATDTRLFLRDGIDFIVNLLKQLCLTLNDLATNHIDTLMPVYTHMQKAQPSTLAHHLLAYEQMFERDIYRLIDCRKRVNILPLGCCACASTSFPIDRNYTAELLKFDGVCNNSIDGVSDRDFVVEFLSDASLIMAHLSRFNEELVYWSGEEFGFITLPDSFSTGSSIMPQKKNPDMCELLRGKSGRVFGDLVAMLTVLKGLPLAYNKDMQEDKEPLFDALDTVTISLRLFNEMLKSLVFNINKMEEGSFGGFTAATDCADFLAKNGIPFRDAHSIIGKMVLYCIENNKRLDELSLKEFNKFSPVFDKSILETVKPKNIIASRIAYGGCSKDTELAAINKNIKKLKDL